MARGKVDQYGVHTDNRPDGLRYHQTVHEFVMGGHKYGCQPLNPLEQIHISRRLAPVILSALKPEGGRKAILARLTKFANLASTEDGAAPEVVASDQLVADALDLATSIFEAAAATDEESVDVIIRKCGGKIWRKNEGGGGQPIWHSNQDLPTYRDLDGFKVLALVSRYLFVEFKDSIAEYIASLNLKPGPALMAAAGAAAQQRPPGAPGGL
ncbi:bacteriophage protein [Methylobacterium sp. GXF4]|nr:bacteriophage protein [Methylobacterium sp. GXF4]